MLKFTRSRSEKITLNCKSNTEISDLAHSFMVNIFWFYCFHKDAAKMGRLSDSWNGIFKIVEGWK